MNSCSRRIVPDMRIGIDASPIAGDRGGVGWHTYHLLRAMLATGAETEFVAYARPGFVPPVETGLWGGVDRLRWVTASKWAMKRQGAADRLDLYHGTNFRLHTTGRCGGVVTIHDLWLERFPQYSPKVLGQWLSSLKTKRLANQARMVVTVSEFSANEVTSLYGLPRERIAVIYNGVSEEWHPRTDQSALAALQARLGFPAKPYILFVGGADPRKNHKTFLRAAALARKDLAGRMLLLVGSPVHPFGSYRNTAESVGLLDQVYCPGRLSTEELALLYSFADLFVFPSLYEGFGMPVLEAMACGAPVLTSKTTALVEVAGDAALLIDPENVQELGEAMVKALKNEPLRRYLKEQGIQRAKQFTWGQAATRTLNLYYELCRSH